MNLSLMVRFRLRIVIALLEGLRGVTDIALDGGASRVGAFQNLAKLKEARLVKRQALGAHASSSVTRNQLRDLGRFVHCPPNPTGKPAGVEANPADRPRS
ncbi:MAG: hypothetical protein ACYCTZ_11195 [Candidatus Dormibacteria bacterium]